MADGGGNVNPNVTVVGVDGWRGRWVAATLSGRRVRWDVHDDFGDVLDTHPDAVVAVDMPIVSTDGPRPVDAAARTWLRDNGGSWQSVFLTPTTPTVASFESGRTHAEAMSLRTPGTPGTSIQAWNLLSSMIDVRDALTRHPEATVVEAHPECSFRMLGAAVGVPIARTSKKTGLGVGLRLRALRTVLDLDLADAPADVPADDLLDACAVAWTARRYADDVHLTLPAGAIAPPRIII